MIEIKAKRAKDSMDTLIANGTEQTLAYISRSGATQAHFVIFNPDPALNWDERVYQRELAGEVVLLGC